MNGGKRLRPNQEPDSTVLRGCTYRFEWLSPEHLSGASCERLWGPKRPGQEGDYSNHVEALYNLHCDIPQGDLRPDGDDWRGFWTRLGSTLVGKVDWFALLARAGDALAGKIRFLPKTLTLPRYGGWSEEEHQREWTDEILWIGGAYGDAQGTDDGLDTELVQRVIDYARQAGFRKIQSVGWSEVPPYAMWGESFRASTYERLGFLKVATTDGCPDAFGDMLNGSHGERTRHRVEEAFQSGIPRESAHQVHVLEREV